MKLSISFSKPGFLVVGPHKTGTTWLYDQLCRVKGFSMPPAKEISFLYHADHAHSLREMEKRIAHGSFDPHIPPTPVDRNMRQQIWADFKNVLRRNHELAQETAEQWWYRLYTFIPLRLDLFSLFLYSRLFGRSSSVITGDVSPFYFRLSSWAIARVKRFFPDLKIIFILRDPVDREWSEIRMNYYSASSTEKFSSEKHFQTDLDEGDYKRTITRWEQHFDKDRILYLFFDDLTDDPQQFMDECLGFLKSGKTEYQVNTEKVGAGVEKLIDPELKKQLLLKNLPQYDFLAEKFGQGSHPARWKEKALIDLSKLNQMHLHKRHHVLG